MNAAGSVLAIPEGWILHPLGRERLQLQLARADSAWVGIVAEWRELPAGSSYVVCAERRAQTPESELQPFHCLSVRGAVTMRPGIGFDLSNEIVAVKRGALLIDPGTVVHDPWRPLSIIEDASPLGRPLRSRPVVVFLGLERDPYLADWVRRLVNGLVRRAVEGRIAVPEPTVGLHLTRPCAPTQESVRALSPRVVVALDDEAVELCAPWLGRGAFELVRLTPETTSEITTQSVRVGRWRRRVEASIGRGASAAAMADLVRRLDRQHESMR
jgi:hypothetical protein